MENNIPSSIIFGICSFVTLYLLIVLIYINLGKYDYFFISFLIGLFVVIFIFVNNISKYIQVKKSLTEVPNKLKKVQTCPEYWLKYKGIKETEEKEPIIKCSSKNIYKTTSIGSIGYNENGKQNIDYKTINLTNINKEFTNEEICKRMFLEYNNYKEEDIATKYTDEEKLKVNWIEFNNNCIKST